MNDVIIAGAGITGAFTAYCLSMRGIPVTLIDRCDGLPAASHHNPGGLNPFHGPGIPGVMAEFSLRAYHTHRRSWKHIAAASGIEFAPRLIKRVILAFDAAEKQRLLDNEKLYRAAAGFSARWLSGVELRRLEPRLSERALGGLLTYGNASVDAEQYTRAVTKAAQALGVRRIEGEVIGFSAGNETVTAELTGGRRCTGGHLILATGAWSNLFASLPAGALTPVRGELLLVVLDGAQMDFDLSHGPDGIYCAADNRCWLGGTRDERGFDFRTTEAGANAILARIGELIPKAGTPRVLRHSCAMRPGTPDGLPIVGRLPGHDRVYVATGSGSKGMLWSAGIANVCVRLLADPMCEASFGHLSIERFAGVTAHSP